MRLLGWVWMLSLTTAALLTEPGANRQVLTGALAVSTVGTGVTLLAVGRGFLGESWYAIFDGVLTLLVAATGWLAGTSDFVAGGYPLSWLFIVAYATNLRWALAAGAVATVTFAVLHLLMELVPIRMMGSIQFVVVALVVGWAFDALRKGEEHRLDAEREREEAERELAAEQQRSDRLKERTEIGRRLHDSVLQTLKLISAAADDPSEVRYLTRVQERDLRRTISEYQSPYTESFRARLLDAKAMVEDRYRVRIEQVIRADAEMSPRLQTLIEAATEAMANAARHSASSSIDLFAEIGPDGVQVNVRDRGKGFNPDSVAPSGISQSIVEPVVALGGTARIQSRPDEGTEVRLSIPSG